MYVGNNLMYNPDKRHMDAYQLEPVTKKFREGTAGFLVHPSIRNKVY